MEHYPSDRLIFILGSVRRSGTNYLFHLLLAHPSCAASLVPEDFLIAHSHLLEDYISAVHGEWEPHWGIDGDAFHQRFRAALIGTLAPTGEPRRVVAKTPSVDNLDSFYRFFPNARLVILVRDGRAAVESALRSFPCVTFDAAAREWARSVRLIRRFEETHRGCPYRIVRYEDLYGNQAAELKRLYEFLELDAAAVDLAALEELPVYGSSALGRKEGRELHWQAMKRTADFNPLERFRNWTPAQHARFNWLAEPELRIMGYEPRLPSVSPLASAIRNQWLDVRHDSVRVYERAQRRIARWRGR